MKTFQCSFGKGVSCELKTFDSAPEKGKAHIQEVIWEGKPTKACVRPYIAWMNSVNQLLANEWGVSLMHVFQLSPKWDKGEVWVYEPGKPPKQVRKWSSLADFIGKQQE